MRFLILGWIAALPFAPPLAAQGTWTLGGGEKRTLVCDGSKLNVARLNTKQVAVECIANPITPPPAPGPGSRGKCGESNALWHGAIVNHGTPCYPEHEHGDAPPGWISSAGHAVFFDGGFNTSPQENMAKHAAMKGFLAKFGETDVYFRIHAASNPLDRAARYHSYEAWARDTSGAVSHWQGWYNTGDPVMDRYARRAGNEVGVRPVMLVVDRTSWDQGIRCEQWYANTAEWSWDFGWTICDATTLFNPHEHLNTAESTWTLAPDGSRGGLRRLEAAWYAFRSHPTGKFWATQFGDVVSGASDARCSATTTKFGVTYQNVCLEQFIAPTMKQVAFPGNAVQKQFDVSGVKVPN